MLHFDFPYEKGTIHPKILPNDTSEIFDIRIALDNFFKIENPCKTFSKKMRNGEFNEMSEEDVTEVAKICTNLAEKYWNDLEQNVPSINILFLISRMLSDYCDSFFNKS